MCSVFHVFCIFLCLHSIPPLERGQRRRRHEPAAIFSSAAVENEKSRPLDNQQTAVWFEPGSPRLANQRIATLSSLLRLLLSLLLGFFLGLLLGRLLLFLGYLLFGLLLCRSLLGLLFGLFLLRHLGGSL